MDNSHLLPGWLAALLTEKFFTACIAHEDARKNEKNIFCLDCCFAICPHCLTPHRSHRLLQVRRYIYHDVLRLKDAEKLMDCVSVQSRSRILPLLLHFLQASTHDENRGEIVRSHMQPGLSGVAGAGARRRPVDTGDRPRTHGFHQRRLCFQRFRRRVPGTC
nr:PLATZ domain-containing protein [Ipomoea batatas]